MGKLLKYEIRKTWTVKLILLAVTALLEIVFLISLYAEKENALALSVVLLTLVASVGVVVVGLASILTLHRDMNTKQSYMLFMTPNSCYRILGAKVLELAVSIVLTGAFFFALGTLDVTLLFAKEGSLSDLWEMIQRFLTSINENLTIDLPTLAAFTACVLCGWLGIILAAYLGEVISAALLYGRRFNGILSFVLIIALVILVNLLQNWAGEGVQGAIPTFLVQGGTALVCAAGMYFLTAKIMEEKLSV